MVMTLQEIQELAGHREVSPWIVKLVGDAVAREREECARLCFQMWDKWMDSKIGNCPDAEDCAAAIRARGRSEALTKLNKAAEDMGEEL